MTGIDRNRLLTFEDFWSVGLAPEPHEIQRIYESGFVGSTCLPPDLVFETKDFYTAFPFAKGIGSGKICNPWRAASALDPGWVGDPDESQQLGGCVGQGVTNAGTIDYSVDALYGETTFEGRLAPEANYRSRGYNSQGANCQQLAEWITRDGPGGLLPRKKYTSPDGSETVDLTRYNPSWATRGSSGVPRWLAEIAAKCKASVYRCSSPEAVRDAIAIGFGVLACGGEGYSSTRNEDGVAAQRGSWAHAKLISGYDGSGEMVRKYGGLGLFLWMHDWGPWNSGPKRHEQPDGSWWTVTRCVEINACWAIGQVTGFNRRLDFSIGEIGDYYQTRTAIVQGLN